MENHKDLILQAFSFGVKQIIPTINQGLFMKFPNLMVGLYLERLSKLNINFKHTMLSGTDIEIKAV